MDRKCSIIDLFGSLYLALQAKKGLAKVQPIGN